MREYISKNRLQIFEDTFNFVKNSPYVRDGKNYRTVMEIYTYLKKTYNLSSNTIKPILTTLCYKNKVLGKFPDGIRLIYAQPIPINFKFSTMFRITCKNEDLQKYILTNKLTSSAKYSVAEITQFLRNDLGIEFKDSNNRIVRNMLRNMIIKGLVGSKLIKNKTCYYKINLTT